MAQEIADLPKVQEPSGQLPSADRLINAGIYGVLTGCAFSPVTGIGAGAGYLAAPLIGHAYAKLKHAFKDVSTSDRDWSEVTGIVLGSVTTSTAWHIWGPKVLDLLK